MNNQTNSNKNVFFIDEIEKHIFNFQSIGGYFKEDKKNTESLSSKFDKENIEVFKQRYVHSLNDKEYIIEGNISYVEFNNSNVIGVKVSTPPILEKKEYNEVVKKRAEFRAFIYMKSTGKTTADILPYGKSILTVSLSDMEEKYTDILNLYILWKEFGEEWKSIRNSSIETMEFPYPSYRTGQEKFMRDIYNVISRKGIAISQAPTGTGKTLSSMFPTLKSMSRDLADKVFYLTAKTIGVKVAEESLDKMRDKGLKAKSVTITAKEKVCINEEVSCNVKKCPYAINHYGKSKIAIFDMLVNEESYTRDTIAYYAAKYLICPYELAIEVSKFCDVVICDYNYVFDFGVRNKMFPDGEKITEKHIYLVDESHNLVDRARDMFSATIEKGKILNASKELHPYMGFSSDLFDKIIKEIEELEKNENLFKPNSEKLPKNLLKYVSELILEINSAIKNGGQNFPLPMALELVSNLEKFNAVAGYFDEDSVMYLERMYTSIKDCRLKLFCVNPNKRLIESYNNAAAVIEFSATFAPMGYFNYLLGHKGRTYGIVIDNPFPKENKEVIVINNISTRLKDREKSYRPIVEHIKEIIDKKVGNYMIFAPSFEYLENVYSIFKEVMPNIKTIKQTQGMNEDERVEYIESFKENPKETMISFNVVSGIFAEGIDLSGDRLIGSIIISPALPTFNVESKIIQNYFNNAGVNGYNIAYTYPGFNKVLQAAGRVIRTETDRGVIALIDDRFDTDEYKSLYPKDWDNIKYSNSPEKTSEIVNDFWNK